jgi:ApbE superfamily uncharacterized protein (UPF0280 family)
MNAITTTTAQATATLVAEGYDEADVTAVINNLIAEGVDIEEQSEDGVTIITLDEVGILRRQLSGTDA